MRFPGPNLHIRFDIENYMGSHIVSYIRTYIGYYMGSYIVSYMRSYIGSYICTHVRICSRDV